MSVIAALLLAGATPLFALSSATPIMVINATSLEIDRKWQRQMRREWAGRCRALYTKRRDLAKELARPGYDPDTLTDFASHFEYGDHGCRKDREFAIRLMDHLVGPGPVIVGSQLQADYLIRLYQENRKPDDPSALARIAAVRHGGWLRGTFFDENLLGWTAADRRAFLARDDVWTWLEQRPVGEDSATAKRLEALFDAKSRRHDPVRGIALAEATNKYFYDARQVLHAAQLLTEGSEVPKDLPRAEALLLRLEDRNEAWPALLALVAPRLESPHAAVRDAAATLLRTRIALVPGAQPTEAAKEARARLVPYFAARLSSKDPELSKNGFDTLLSFVELKTDAALPPVIAVLEKQLRGKSLADKRPAWTSLSRVVRAGYAEGRMLLDEDIRRTGSLVEIQNPDDVVSTARTFITGDDYPPRAMRNEEEGIVSLKLLVGPDGRGVDGFVTKSAGPILDAEVVKVAIRRIRVKATQYAGRYLMLTLPDIQFILPECLSDRPPNPAPGAVAVIGTICPRPVQEAPTPVYSLSHFR